MWLYTADSALECSLFTRQISALSSRCILCCGLYLIVIAAAAYLRAKLLAEIASSITTALQRALLKWKSSVAQWMLSLSGLLSLINEYRPRGVCRDYFSWEVCRCSPHHCALSKTAVWMHACRTAAMYAAIREWAHVLYLLSTGSADTNECRNVSVFTTMPDGAETPAHIWLRCGVHKLFAYDQNIDSMHWPQHW